MDKKRYISLWITIQTLLFILPFIVAIIAIPYQIKYDKGYIENVQVRVLDNGGTFEGAVEDWKDTEGAFYKRQFKQENKEIYYFEGLGIALIVAISLQMVNILWWQSYYIDY